MIAGAPSKVTRRQKEDRYMRVYLYGKLEVPGNTIPSAAQCNVTRAEQQIEDRLNKHNSDNYDMCTNGLDLSADNHIETDGRLLSSLPADTVPYQAGKHDSVEIHDRSQYILHPFPR
jgi:hypothetical protein